MTDHNRRQFLSVMGATLGAGLIAGCLGDDGGQNDGWTDVDEIRLEATADHWLGVDPAQIEGEENPTLELAAGQEYTITWENVDGLRHNLVIMNDDSDVVEDYATDGVEGVGTTETLEVVASTEMSQYVCNYHPIAQVGDIDVAE